MAAQLTATKGPSARAERAWMARAASSLPVPLGPWISTLCSPGAMVSMVCFSRWMAGDDPTMVRSPRSAMVRLRSRFSRTTELSRAMWPMRCSTSSGWNGLVR